jgi:hypothetical protein
MERIGTVINRVLDDVQATREHRAAPAARDTRPLVDAMAKVLVADEVDLGDERAVLRCLDKLHFNPGDVLTLSDAAVDRARAMRAANPDLRRLA